MTAPGTSSPSWSASLPTPAARNLAVHLRPDAVRQVRGGHPWVFDGSVRRVTGGADGRGTGAPGDLAVLFDGDRRFVGIGLWDPTSPIVVKVLHHGDRARIDDAFLGAAVRDAVARRSALHAEATAGTTTGYRLVHGENDGLPGVVLDRYGGSAVLKLYTPAWFPHLPALVAAVEAAAGPDRLVLRLARNVSAGPTHGLDDGTVLLGDAPDGPVLFREHGLAFEADVVHGQKTGTFLDQRDNRALVAARCRGAGVLDVCSCTGGFTVHAAAGGARRVVSVDQSRPALAATARNLGRNASVPGVTAAAHEAVADDAFRALTDLARRGERFDVVVVDPPSFASRRTEVARALDAHARLTGLAVEVLRDGGTLFQASCSSRVGADAFEAAVVRGAARAAARLCDLQRTGQPADHPVGFPEGAYLHGVLATVRRTD